MTAAAVAPPPLTVAEFLVLEEDERHHYELQEGVVMMMTNKPRPRHQLFLARLIVALMPRLSDDLVLLPDISIDLELTAPTAPGFVRAPDLVVVRREAYERVGCEGGVLRARDVVLVVEILSPSTRRVDTRVKHDEYADAGIGHYWSIDLDVGPALTACHLGGAFGYVDDEAVNGTFVTDVPFPARVDLGALG